jgi:uncharacterized protein YndB with AHSA1/START domain
MTTKVSKSVRVDVPVTTAYNQWTQFEEFPHFMGGVSSVTQLSDDRLRWVAEIAGVKRQWEARILEQVPDRKIAWAATEGATNAGTVLFEELGGGQTSVTLELEYEPEGLVEKAGDLLNIVEKQAESDLDRFKAFIESEDYATGAWRGSVNQGAGVGTPGVDAAAASRGDSGKAGISGKVAAAGAAAVVAGAAAAVAGKKKADADATPEVVVPPPPAEGTVPVTGTVPPSVPPTAVPADVPPLDDTTTAAPADVGTLGDVDPVTGERVVDVERDDRI